MADTIVLILIDEETGTQRLNDLPKVTKLISVQTLFSGLDF